MFRIRQAQRYGVKIGFKGFEFESKEKTNKPLLSGCDKGEANQ